MAVLSQRDTTSYDELFRAHSSEFTAYLARLLGRAREGAGGRLGVEDTLQEAMLRIARDWPQLAMVEDEERDRRLYRCLRDAAGQALRDEHGRVGARRQRPRLVAYDFRELELDGEELDAREQELTAAVLGVMARQVADLTDGPQPRAILNRAVLLAGLRALSEREAVALIAVDHLGWDQQQLADHLDVDFGQLRGVLFTARKVFYGVVRHAVGVELDDEERATLHAYLTGELSGREKRLARRHLQHCEACKAFVREQQLFGDQAQRVLAPLPFVIGAGAMVRGNVKKPAAGMAVSGAGKGLLGQAGAAKALAATVGMLGTGVAVTGWLAERDQRDPRPPATSGAVIGVPTELGELPAGPRATSPGRASQSRDRATKRRKDQTTLTNAGGSAGQSKAAATSSPTTTQTSSPQSQSPPPAGGGSSGASDETGGGEFFGGGA